MKPSARLVALIIGLATLPGCGPSGVGSVDWADSPKARAIGAPPRPPSKPVQNRIRGAQSKPGEFLPG
jgi:hypothetical protein